MMGTRTAVTSEEGQYRFPAIPPGVYQITYELAGFNTVRRDEIRVTLGFTATVNVEMGVASLQESVTVTGAVAGRRHESTSISTNFDAKQLGESAERARPLGDSRRVAGHPDEPDRRRRQRRRHADRLRHLRHHGSEPADGRRHRRHRRDRRRRLLLRLRVLRRGGRERGGAQRRDAVAGRAVELHQQVGRQRVPRHVLRRLREREDPVAQHRRRSDRTRR